jgi:purine-nucleoside phosphorylase
LYKKKTAAILTVSDNLITGEIGFLDPRFSDAQKKMIDIAFKFVEESDEC